MILFMIMNSYQLSLLSIVISISQMCLFRNVYYNIDNAYIERYNIYNSNIRILALKMLKIASILRLISTISNLLFPIKGETVYNLKYN